MWRSTVGPLSHLALLGIAFQRRHATVARVFIAGHVAAVVGLTGQLRGWRVPLPMRVIGQVLYLQAVALGGMRRYARGDRVLKWAKPAR